MIRGDPKVVICPKVPLVMLIVGPFQLAWFRTLKKSARKSSLVRSVRRNCRLTAMSQL